MGARQGMTVHVHLMRVRMAKGATILGNVATRLGEAGVDISRLQTRRKDEHHVVLDLLLDDDGQHSLLGRDDLQVRGTRTGWLARRP